jgi:hypothetical protein
MASTKPYQHASDAYDPGAGTGVRAFSGVISSTGHWIACANASHTLYGADWAAYQTWRATPTNVPDPHLKPTAGGYTIVLRPGEVAYGVMLNSM